MRRNSRLLPKGLVAAVSIGYAAIALPDGLDWQPCGVNAECTEIQVPLDWNYPHADQITLAFARHQATDPEQRIGTLVFMNGQGASAMDFVAPRIGAGEFPRELTERFDIVGIDPRGGGINPSGSVLGLPVHSTELDCQLRAHVPEARYFPETEEEFEQLVAHNRAFAESCGSLAGHTGALSHARDVEAVRLALGENTISWISWTTGSFVGLLYASEYPERVRAMVLDQPFDAQRPSRPFVRDHAEAVQGQFDRFVEWCDRTPACIYHGEDVRAAFSQLIDQANEVPIPATGPTPPPEDEGAPIEHPLTGDEFLFMTEQLLEIGDLEVVPGLTGFDALAFGIFEAQFGITSVFPGSYMYGNGWPGFWNRYRVHSCTDFDSNIHNYQQFRQYMRQVRRVAPDTRGISQAWDIFTGCIGWPLERENSGRALRFSGLLPPILVVSSRYSAYAPYEHAQRLARRLPNGRLLTYEGDTHIVWLSSDCAIGWMVDYLVSGETPPPSTSCPQEGLLAQAPAP